MSLRPLAAAARVALSPPAAARGASSCTALPSRPGVAAASAYRPTHSRALALQHAEATAVARAHSGSSSSSG